MIKIIVTIISYSYDVQNKHFESY